MAAGGLVDHFEDARMKPRAAHLDDFERSLVAKGRTPEYIALKVGRVRGVLDGCGWVYPREIDPAGLEKSPHALRAEGGRSIQTSNDWLQATTQFMRWLHQNSRLDRDPLAGLKGGNVKTDRRHIRRTLPADQLAKLLDVTRASAETVRGLGGDARHHAYVMALSTGFRLEEVAGLCPENFDLSADPPMVRLAAADIKNRQGANQPLPRPTADLLATYLGGKPVSQPIWPGTWGTRGANMLKLDLKAAGIPYSVPGPDGPEFFDFHALRATNITMLVQSGATVREAQVLARHSDPRLTLGVYTKLQTSDIAAAANRLPN